MTVAADKFIEENTGMLRSLAQKFLLQTSKFSLEDLLQEANMSVVRHIGKFDEDRKEAKVQTYLYQCVFRDLRDFVRKNKHDLFVSGYQQKKEYKEAIESNNVDENGNAILDISNRMATFRVEGHVSSNDLGSEYSIADTLDSGNPPVIDGMIREEQVEILRAEIAQLTSREQTIIKAKYIDGKSYNEIATDFNLTRQRIEQISNGALDKLRKTVVKKLNNDLYT